ncbi:glycoprotein-N-acetylgalactosamine 3-beta-galactosyltransferase 1-like [Homarus americanus]|uniref:glycoprotein-N-acetylgalactosamine 3-beta-galactosyltransferase 1-like n=1 Tax=Homarus americanus TaxID=6706 RepID=UPI001C43859D|nr:glycoprotein-N-acetylgalactosamine 3-beta-galactosyltransferase 1-like [Homarus americanus]
MRRRPQQLVFLTLVSFTIVVFITLDHRIFPYRSVRPSSIEIWEARVLCFIPTSPKYHLLRAQHVKNTWGQRCDQQVFLSSKADKEVGAVQLKVKEGYNNLWGKTRASLKYLYHNHLDDAEWFYKADDDTFAIVENLKHMLKLYDPDFPIYFGAKLRAKDNSQVFMSGGAGYVLSRAALKLVVEKGFTNSTICKAENKGREDVELGRCMQAVGVMFGDSRDHLGRERFLCLTPELLLPGWATANKHGWFWNIVYYPMKEGPMCCSERVVSFHYVKPSMMYVFYYLIYQVHLSHFQGPLPRLPPDTSSIPKEVLEKYGMADRTSTHATQENTTWEDY